MTVLRKSLAAAIITITALGSPELKAQDKLVIGENAHWQVEMQTSRGTVKMELFNDTPLHRDNFVKLAESGFYDYILFHRVIKNFVIQAGDPTSKEASKVRTYGEGDAGYTIPAEILPGYFHESGVLAAAREGDEQNPERRSSGSHFYIVVGEVHTDSTLAVAAERIRLAGGAPLTPERIETYKTVGGTPRLDGSYTIFGRVVSGMKIVRSISNSATDSHDRPKEDVYIKKIKVEKVKNR